jgi:hypothetical protein
LAFEIRFDLLRELRMVTGLFVCLQSNGIENIAQLPVVVCQLWFLDENLSINTLNQPQRCDASQTSSARFGTMPSGTSQQTAKIPAIVRRIRKETNETSQHVPNLIFAERCFG